MADAEPAAGERVQRCAVAGAVVAEDGFDADAVAGVEGNRALEEAGCCGRLLVAEDFGVGEPAVVVDSDVDELPAFLKRASLPALVGCVAEDAVAWAGDPAQLLHVNVHQLARA